MSTATATAMLTIKLVVIGVSGVGKTSLRDQYISGRFLGSYRATIGADFISKTIPHPTKPEQNVTLQIWDTAGQERFSSLSTALFRGADAVVLAFDVYQAETLNTLKKWWTDFCKGVPLTEEEILEYPCFIVGNKVDLHEEDQDDKRIPLDVVHHFLIDLIPFQDPPPSATSSTPPPSHIMLDKKSPSIAIKSRISPISSVRQDSLDGPHSQPKAMNKFDSVSSIQTNNTLYLTPSSSVLTDIFHTAYSSPDFSSSVLSASVSTPVFRAAPTLQQRRPTTASARSASSGSAVTITPSLFARELLTNANGVSNANESASTMPEGDISNSGSVGLLTPDPPPSLERGPSLHFTSAKTGEGVKELFEHIVARVLCKIEYEDCYATRQLCRRGASGMETIIFGVDNQRQLKRKIGCCA